MFALYIDTNHHFGFRRYDVFDTLADAKGVLKREDILKLIQDNNVNKCAFRIYAVGYYLSIDTGIDNIPYQYPDCTFESRSEAETALEAEKKMIASLGYKDIDDVLSIEIEELGKICISGRWNDDLSVRIDQEQGECL